MNIEAMHQVLDLQGTARQREYAEHYWSLIVKANDRALDVEQYVEKHHVFPKCICGDNDITVALTPEEHYVAHQLLVKMFPEASSLWYAAKMMGTTRKNNKTYGWLKREVAVRQRQAKLGKPLHTEETKQKISEYNQANPKKTEFKKGHTPWNKGGTVSEETREKIRQGNLGKVRTEETRKRMSVLKKGRQLTQRRLMCPYCNKSGGASGMTRYHFENCKQKKYE